MPSVDQLHDVNKLRSFLHEVSGTSETLIELEEIPAEIARDFSQLTRDNWNRL